MSLILIIFSLIIFLKLFLFWLWLWQLKEYHLGRFLAHFETQKIKKFLSSFWRLKYPKFTRKIISIFLSGILLAALWNFFFSGILLIIFAPLFSSLLVLLFQIPTVFWRKIIINKAKKKREELPNLLVIGITGSYGKTSTKEFLATILEEKFSSVVHQKASYGRSAIASGEGGKVLKTKEHQNSEVGISQCILNNLTPEHEIFVVEMGAYNRGGIKLLCDIAKPKIGIITGINEQHLATFGSQENIIRAKFELIENLSEDGTAIFNGNNKRCLELFEKTKIPKKLSGKKPTIVDFLPRYNFDIWIENTVVEKEFISFKVFSADGDSADFRINLLGAQNGENILLAVAGARELGMSLDEISKACQKIEPWQGGLQLKKGINGLNIIDATYSANPDGVISHLDYLKIWPNKKIIIMPCLIELGSASKKIHKKIGQKITEVCDLAIITTKERFREIQEGVTTFSAIAKKPVETLKVPEVVFIEDPKEIFKKIKSFCKEDDVILLESRVPNQLIKQLII